MGGKRSSELTTVLVQNSPQTGRIRTPIQRKEHNIYGPRPATEAVRNDGTPQCVTWASRRAREASKPSRSREQYNRRKKEATRLPVEPNGLRTEAALQVPVHIFRKEAALTGPTCETACPPPLAEELAPMRGHWCQHSTMRHRDWSDDGGRRTWAVRDLC